MKSRSERATERAIPVITPRVATARKQKTVTKKSDERTRAKSRIDLTSTRPTAAAMTTAASAATGRFLTRSGAATRSTTIAAAPTRPVSCVRAPAACATGVREELEVTGKP